MAKYLVETFYTCSFKVSHYLDDINEENIKSLEKREDGKFEILDVKLDNRKTKNLDKTVTDKAEKIEKEANKHVKKLIFEEFLRQAKNSKNGQKTLDSFFN